MKRIRRSMVLGLGLLVAVSMSAHRVQATLGESADSVEADRNALSAVRHSTSTHDRYTIQEIGSVSVAVREYISPSGIVFGISWNGLINPDLKQVLGSYADEYQKALQRSPRKLGQRHLQVKTNRVVVEQWGHMRNLQGRAYAPALIPPGVSVDEIR